MNITMKKLIYVYKNIKRSRRIFLHQTQNNRNNKTIEKKQLFDKSKVVKSANDHKRNLTTFVISKTI